MSKEEVKECECLLCAMLWVALLTAIPAVLTGAAAWVR